ncbi:Y-family DNA polymerase [Candidatus Hepatoplasma crinochetorum]|uniref:DNA polymerase IV n=1 Tax=Candidatus Hepatoplasma crinochetorum Av TaxID=1427984 RepID=W8GN31_9MOLU|nr:DNA polymerase IV [Candidatus Hepatoplasma crinochetorum]AHK22401.1 DNA polymerase IV [Candidatus Hepatoplasma crinochetorum Av]BDV02990.1 MAG: DNA polymerase IV [Candidatus Hepatoplasma crinochetorum]
MKRTILTIDVDAFFAQVEEIKNIKYKSKPIAIGKKINGRGVVSTCNYIARKYNVYSGQPIFKAQKSCPNLILIEPNFKDYTNYSEKIFKIINSFSNILEISSIDECYLDITKLITEEKNPFYWAKKIQSTIFNKLKITVSIGISNRKVLAKIASKIKKPFGIYSIFQNEIKEKLWPLPIDTFHGIGLQTTKKFNNLNLTKIEDLAKLKAKDQYVILRKQIGKNIDLLIDEANGIGEDSLENKEKDLKSISAHKTFQNTIFDYENLINELKELVNKIVQKLNYRNLTARTVFLVTKNRKNLNNVENTIEKAILLRKTQSKRILLDHYENQYEIIYSYALKLFDNYYNENGIDFLGIGLADLKDKIYIKKQLKFDQYFEDNFIKKEQSIIKEDNLDNLILNINGFFNNKILIKGKYLLKENKYQDKRFSNRDQIKFKTWGK